MLKLMLVLAAVIVTVTIVAKVFLRLSGKSKSDAEKVDELSKKVEELVNKSEKKGETDAKGRKKSV